MTNWVDGYGKSPSKLMIVGEAPGRVECETGIPFSGKTGMETNNLLLRYVGLEREQVYTTNLFKYPLDDKKTFTEGELEWQGTILRDEITKVDPEFILCLGAIATHWFLSCEYEMETLNGMPHEWEGRIVVPSIHPAATFRESALLSWVIEAFQNMRLVTDGKLSVPTASLSTKVRFSGFEGDDWFLAIDTEAHTDGSPYIVTFTAREGSAGYAYVDNYKVVKWLTDITSDPEFTVFLHNALYDLPQLWKLGIYPCHWIDTMQIAFLLQTLPLGLKPLAYRLCRMRMRNYDDVVWGGMGIPISDAKKLFPNRDLSDVPEDERIPYACADADATLRVYNRMLPLWYKRMGEVLQRDMDIQPMIIAMMQKGMKIDVEYIEKLGTEFEVENLLLLDSIRDIAGEKFNPKSAPQVAELLYKKLKLGRSHRIDQTKWGGTTGAKTLKKIEDEHPVVGMIEEYRARKDLKDKYIDVLPKYAQTDGRVHTNISMVRVAQSGRLASSSPNLLAQPVRTSDGRRIRDGFIAEEGYSIVSTDLNQIEMRLMAHCSQDPVLLSVYRNNGDVHTDTAMRTFNINDPSHVDELKHRYPSKRTGFGVIYRITARGLSIQLQGDGLAEWNEEKCQWLIDSWLREHSGVEEFWNRTDRDVKRYGQISDMWGRMKLIPEVKSVFRPVRDAGLRKATNVPMQSGAQGIIKEAMRQIWNKGMQEWINDKLAHPLIQIHDSLDSEVKDDFIQEYVGTVVPIMENVVELSIPIVAEPKVGKRWGSQEKLK